MSVRSYYQLTKPGIIYGNALPLVAGFLLAAVWHINFVTFVAVLVGQSLIIASACVVNNYIDRSVDAKMKRTSERALVTGKIRVRNALVYAAVLGIAGAAILVAGTNWLTLAVGLFGFFMYVVVYGIAKRRSPFGTIVGSVSGALPPVAGYVAVSNQLDMIAALLFLILTLWQMPHFYAIAMYRHTDYKEAGIPVLPLVRGMSTTKFRIMAYILAMTLAMVALVTSNSLGYCYALAAAALGAWWFLHGLRTYRTLDDTTWARQIFLKSLSVLLIASVIIPLGTLLP